MLIIWLVALVGTNVLAQAAGSNFSNNLTGGAQPVQQILNRAFPAEKGSPAQVVITSAGPISAVSVRDRTARMVAAMDPLAHVSEVVSPFTTAGAHQISADGHIAYVQVQFDEIAGNLPQAAINKVITTAQSFAAPGYGVAGPCRRTESAWAITGGPDTHSSKPRTWGAVGWRWALTSCVCLARRLVDTPAEPS